MSAALLTERIRALGPDTIRLLKLPGILPCTVCGRPVMHRKTGRPRGVLRSTGQGRCGACYQAKRQPLIEPIKRYGRLPKKSRHDTVREPRGQRVGIDGPAWGTLDLPDAACKGADVRGFDVPERDERDETRGRNYRSAIPMAAVDAAQRYCAVCPVLIECDTFARTHRAVGLWGGRWRPEVGLTREIRTLTLPGGTTR